MKVNQKASSRIFVDLEHVGDMDEESKRGTQSGLPKPNLTCDASSKLNRSARSNERNIEMISIGATPKCKYATAEREFQMMNDMEHDNEHENGFDTDTNGGNTPSNARIKCPNNAGSQLEIQDADTSHMRHSNDHMAPLISLTELLQEDENFIKYKRSNIAFDAYSAIPLLIYLLSVFITRGSVVDPFSLNAYLSTAFVLSILALGGFTVAIYILLSERLSNPNLNTTTKKKKRLRSMNTTEDSDSDIAVDSIEATNEASKKSLAYNRFFKRIIETTLFQESFEILALTGSMSIGEKWTQFSVTPSLRQRTPRVHIVYFK